MEHGQMGTYVFLSELVVKYREYEREKYCHCSMIWRKIQFNTDKNVRRKI